MAILPNVTSFYISSTGELLGEVEGSTLFHAQSNNANLILINLEDGTSYNSTAFVNFTPRVKTPYTTHWFYASYQGTVEKTFEGDTKTFSQFALLVPKLVLQNHTPRGVTQNDITIIQRFGSNHLGVYSTLAELEAKYPIVPMTVIGVATTLANLESNYPANENNGDYGLVSQGPDIGFYQSDGTEWLPINATKNTVYVEIESGSPFLYNGTTYINDDYFVTYVIDYPYTGFYQIEYDGEETEYVWTRIDGSINTLLNAKQYNVGQISIQAGFSNVGDVPSVETTQYQLLAQALANLEVLLNEHRELLDPNNPFISAETFVTEQRKTKSTHQT